MICGGYFDPQKRSARLSELENIMSGDDFWNDKKNSEKVIAEYNELKTIIDEVSSLKEDIKFHLNSLKNEKEFLNDVLVFANEEVDIIKDKLDKLELHILLGGKYDKNDAVLEIHSGAGGTEACDWADMLYRMYFRWCEKKKYKIEIINEVKGNEVGVKSITLVVRGFNAYGYLKSEKGVHRLVRISPFDSNSRRHTSFASVEVSPVIDTDINLSLDEKDLRIDVFRSTGAGGQGVNTTDSAVRITHIPTNIVVTCQNERSQLQNKEKCMQILKSKLLKMEEEKKEAEMKKLKGQHMEINFGSQIRSYIMCPYTLVKDHWTGAEDVNVDKVLDGNIDKFIYEYLKGR